MNLKKHLGGSVSLLLVTLGLGTVSARATLLTTNVVADSLIANGISNNYGGYGALEIGGFGYQVRSVLRFDVSAIPVGSTINSIQLQLRTSYVDTQSAGSGDRIMSVYQVTNSWTEGTSSGTSSADATWANRKTGTPWATAGGDFAPTALAQYDWSGFAEQLSFNSANTSFTVNILNGPGDQAARNALINTWLSGANYGFLLKNSLEGASDGMGIRSRENTAGPGPVLLIDYTAAVPEPSTILLLLCGGGLIAAWRRR